MAAIQTIALLERVGRGVSTFRISKGLQDNPCTGRLFLVLLGTALDVATLPAVPALIVLLLEFFTWCEYIVGPEAWERNSLPDIPPQLVASCNELRSHALDNMFIYTTYFSPHGLESVAVPGMVVFIRSRQPDSQLCRLPP